MYRYQLKRQDVEGSSKTLRRYVAYNEDYEKLGKSKTSAIRGLFDILGKQLSTGILIHLMMLAKLCFVMELKFVAQVISYNYV
jgi:hypothetical protein